MIHLKTNLDLKPLLLVPVLALLALLSYHPGDAAWSTSGQGGGLRNWVGRAGAWVSDLAFFGLGFSAWWCLIAGAQVWLSGFARWMRGPAEEEHMPSMAAWRQSRWTFWAGLVLLLAASASQARSRAQRRHKEGYGVIVAARRANPQDSQLIRRGVWVRRRRDGSSRGADLNAGQPSPAATNDIPELGRRL